MLALLPRIYRAAQLGLWSLPHTTPYGVRLSGNRFDGTFQMICRKAYGDFVLESLKSGPADATFLDIGANIGLFSTLMYPVYGGRVVSFEPNVDTFKLLQSNLAENGCETALAVCAGVVADEVPSATLHQIKHRSGAASINKLEGTTRTTRITLAGPSYLRAMVPGDNPLVVKIDVEGLELGVIQALAAADLLQRVTTLVVEMNDTTNSASDMAAIRKTLTDSGLTMTGRHGTDSYGDELYTR